MPPDSPGTTTAENSDGKAKFKYLLTLPFPSEEGEPSAETDSVTFVGTATVIIRFGELTILADPCKDKGIELRFIHPTSRIRIFSSSALAKLQRRTSYLTGKLTDTRWDSHL